MRGVVFLPSFRFQLSDFYIIKNKKKISKFRTPSPNYWNHCIWIRHKNWTVKTIVQECSLFDHYAKKKKPKNVKYMWKLVMNKFVQAPLIFTLQLKRTFKFTTFSLYLEQRNITDPNSVCMILIHFTICPSASSFYQRLKLRQ